MDFEELIFSEPEKTREFTEDMVAAILQSIETAMDNEIGIPGKIRTVEFIKCEDPYEWAIEFHQETPISKHMILTQLISNHYYLLMSLPAKFHIIQNNFGTYHHHADEFLIEVDNYQNYDYLGKLIAFLHEKCKMNTAIAFVCQIGYSFKNFSHDYNHITRVMTDLQCMLAAVGYLHLIHDIRIHRDCLPQYLNWQCMSQALQYVKD